MKNKRKRKNFDDNINDGDEYSAYRKKIKAKNLKQNSIKRRKF